VSPSERTDGKADFTHLYNQPDPRHYFGTLRRYRYQIPGHAQPVFRALTAARRSDGGGAVLDVCCSYGVNAALLRCDLSLDDLYQHYGSPDLAGLSTEQLAEHDRAWYAERLRSDATTVLGLDAASLAVAYASDVDLLDAGWGEDLEKQDPSAGLADAVVGVDLVTITGGVGYVSAHTFERLLGALQHDPAPWVAAFVLRTYSYADITDVLGRHGLVTERATTSFRQRQFATDGERDTALAAVRGRGLDPLGREADGWYHCDFFLSRPAGDDDPALADLIATTPPPA